VVGESTADLTEATRCAVIAALLAEAPAVARPGFVDQPDDDGCTALYWACAQGLPKPVERLLAAGADPNRVSVRRAPLHVATIWGHLGCLEALLATGANPGVVDMDGRTARQCAEARGLADCLARLQLAELGGGA
jgi:ankyrin repeat protein